MLFFVVFFCCFLLFFMKLFSVTLNQIVLGWFGSFIYLDE